METKEIDHAFLDKTPIRPVIERFYMSKDIEEKLKSLKPNFGFNGVGEFVFRRTYSRNDEDWADVVIRVINGILSIRKDHYAKNHLKWDEKENQSFAEEMALSMFNMEWLPPGRGLWMMGTEFVYFRGSMALVNCAATDTEEDLVHSAEWAMDCLMNGVGVGFSTKWKGIAKIPDKKNHHVYVVEDSREGWVESIIRLLCSYIESPKYGRCSFPVFDYSQIREKGRPIKGFGGTASGPEPLKKLHARLETYLDNFSRGYITVQINGKKVEKPYDHTRMICDVFNAIGSCVVAGNVRRSAEICLGSPLDPTFIALKNYEKNPERAEIGWMSNNSVVLTRNDDYSEFKLIPEIANGISNNGEPGIINLYNVQKYGRFGDKDYGPDEATLVNPCFSGDTLIAVADERHAVPISDLAKEGKDVPVYSIDPETGDVSIKWGRNPRVTGTNKKLLRVHFSQPHSDEFIDVTPNHKFITTDDRIVLAKDLKKGDSIPQFEKKQWSDGYIRVKTGPRKTRVEHRMIAKFHEHDKFMENYDEEKKNGCCETKGVVVHHKDEDKSNNSLENLEITTPSKHVSHHNEKYKGSGNPMYGKKHKEETKEKISKKAKERCSDPEYRKKISDGFSEETKQKLSKKIKEQRVEWDETRLIEQEEEAERVGLKTVRISDSKLVVEKACENPVCKEVFQVDWGKRERAFCSISCANSKESAQENRKAGQKLTYEIKARSIFFEQAKVYSELLEEKGSVMKKDWEAECGKRGIPHRLNPKSSNKWIAPNWKEFIEMVKKFNHKVSHVEEREGKHTVYNITVDDFHTVGVITDVKKDKLVFRGIYTKQCGEIPLCDKELCNLSEVFPTRCLGPAQYYKALEYATFYSSTVSLLPTHRTETNKIVSKNRRIGVSISGITQWEKLSSPEWKTMNYTTMTTFLRNGYKLVRRVNEKLAEDAGINKSIRVTTIKPSGTLSLLAGVTSGVHFPVSRYAIRRIRVAEDSPLSTPLKEAKIPFEKDKYSDGTLCFEFVVDHGDVRSCSEVSPWEQFSLVALLQRAFSDNCVSATISFDKEKDGKNIHEMLAMFIPVLKSVSLLPFETHNYEQPPYESITREEYERRKNSYVLPSYSSIKTNVPDGSKYCSNESCDYPQNK